MSVTVVPDWWIVLILLGVFALMVYWDLKSRPKRWRLFRLLAIVLMLISLLGVNMRPYVKSNAEKLKVVLLTEGSEPAKIDSLKRMDFRVAKGIEEYLAMNASHNIEELLVAGNGLETWELEQVKHEFVYQAANTKIEGPIEMKVPELSTHSVSPLAFRVLINEPIDVHLVGIGIDRATQSIDPEQQNVIFEVSPKVAGNLTYEIIGTRADDTLFSELVPVKVKERAGFNALILTDAPSFEIRFLKNLLMAEGYGVAERLQVTKGTFRESFNNMESRPLSRLTKNLLEDFKIVITDGTSYDRLSNSEKQYLNSAIKRGSLGVVWMGGESNDWMQTKQMKPVEITLKSGQQAVELETAGVTSTKQAQSIFFQGNVVGHSHDYGIGKVMLPILASTYQLKLKGFDKLYSNIWNAILQPVIGFDLSTSDVRVSDFPRENEPMNFTYQWSDDEAVYLDSIRLGTSEQWHQPDIFSAKAWPKVKGWSSFQIGDKNHSFFVFGEQDWSAQKAYQKRAQTAGFTSQISKKPPELVKMDQPVSRWLFFFVIIASLGFLWVEQRLN